MILITILTCIVYILANSFSYKIGSQRLTDPPLYDIIHDNLPDLSKKVHIRDYILILMILPAILIRKLWKYIPNLWYAFLIVVFIKALCIFFTNIPSSHPSCHNPSIIDLNHCHHCSVSGHSALATILALLYINGGFNKLIIWTSLLLYSILIVITRAHYSQDVIQGVVISLLAASTTS